MSRPNLAVEKPDISEKGGPVDGVPQSLDTRLFMQLLVFDNVPDASVLIGALQLGNIPGVIYEDVCNPFGAAILTWSEDPAHFVKHLRAQLRSSPFNHLRLLPEFTMFGRTYSLGHEPDLRHWLLTKPVETACNPDWPWAVWYPLRRKGAFMTLPPDEQRKILMDHGRIGMAYVEHDLVHDIRLAAHGLDRADNDFVIGLTGSRLAPLSKIVEAMRRTIQTSTYLEKLGPFFIGHAIYQSPGLSTAQPPA
jgi:chlorite dismutase